MAENTIVQSGTFVGTGSPVTLKLRSDIDWMRVINYTEADAGTQNHGTEYYWQRGMAAGLGLVYYHPAADQTLAIDSIAAHAGFTLIDTSDSPVGAIDATLTDVSAAAIPVATIASTALLQVGDVVRFIDVTGAQQLGGYDFTIGNNTFSGTDFSLDYMDQIVAGTTGSIRKIAYNPQFYPRHRSISKITQAASAVITMTVAHGYTVGQKVRIKVPSAFGMIEMNDELVTITAITAGTITVNVDSTGFTAFAFPLTAIGAVGFSQALVIPVGEAATSDYANLLDDATENRGYIGMILATGVLSPAGSTSDVIFWTAGKSSNL